MRFEFYVVKGPDVGKGLAFAGKPTITVGRSSQCDFQVRDTKVSRVHCSIHECSEGYLLKDHGSENGTHLNGEPVDEKILADGDRISFGDTVLSVLVDQTSMSVDGNPQELMPRRNRYARELAAKELASRAASRSTPSLDALEASPSDAATSLPSSGPQVAPRIAARFEEVRRSIAAKHSADPALPASPPAPPAGPHISWPTPRPAPGADLERPDEASKPTGDSEFEPSSEPEAAIARLEGYRTLRRIGRGAKASVLLAEQVCLNRSVAIKVLDPAGECSERDLKRFMREADAVAQLPHPNIVTIHERGTVSGFHYLVMEYLSGGNVAETLAQRPMPVSEAVHTSIQVLTALDYAHTAGIIHRDVKPHNILFAAWGGAKLVDFGFVKQLTFSLGDSTEERGPVGSLGYMAPEMLAGERPMDATPDIWSLGSTLYHMLTGKVPYEARSFAEHVLTLQNDAIEPPSRLNPDVGKTLEQLVLQCLEKEPNRRPQTAAEVGRRLQAELGGEAAAS